MHEKQSLYAWLNGYKPYGYKLSCFRGPDCQAFLVVVGEDEWKLRNTTSDTDVREANSITRAICGSNPFP